MSSYLAPFDPDASCPKCGASAIGAKFHRRSKISRGPCCREHSEVDHLARTCGRCDFTWGEGTLDDPDRLLRMEEQRRNAEVAAEVEGLTA